MKENVWTRLRYWSFLALKLALAALAARLVLEAIWYFWPLPYRTRGVRYPVFGQDLAYTTVIGLWFLLSSGLAYLCVWDQRYRCRTCLRRLRMPIQRGSWSRMLQFGWPETEYICAYGHGRLNVSEFQITGTDAPAWTPQGDMWEELFVGAGDDDSRKPGPR